jgi:hypothetical protein
MSESCWRLPQIHVQKSRPAQRMGYELLRTGFPPRKQVPPRDCHWSYHYLQLLFYAGIIIIIIVIPAVTIITMILFILPNYIFTKNMPMILMSACLCLYSIGNVHTSLCLLGLQMAKMCRRAHLTHSVDPEKLGCVADIGYIHTFSPYVCVYGPIYESIYLSICLSACCLSIYMFLYLSLYLPNYRSIYPSIYLSMYLSIYPSI